MGRRELTDAFTKLLALYDGSYSRGIDWAISETCADEVGREVRRLIREEDARIVKTWPEHLGRTGWEIEAAHGREAVLLRLRKARNRLRRDESKANKQATQAESATSPDAGSAGRAGAVL